MERQLRWMRLDNAAKIYPAARRRSWSNLFRVSATLKEDIDASVMQKALDLTVKRFPSIAVRIRRGMFWYYLEEIKNAPKIQKESVYLLHRKNPTDNRPHKAQIHKTGRSPMVMPRIVTPIGNKDQ